MSSIQVVITNAAIANAIKEQNGKVTNSQGIVITLHIFNKANTTEPHEANKPKIIYKPRNEVLLI